jgi:hypothetical protein
MYKPKKLTPINGVTATTVSAPIYMGYAKKATLLLERTGHASGSVIFTVQAALDYSDGGDFIPEVNMISNDVNNHSQTLERNRTVELNANGKVMVALDLEHFGYEYIQIKATESGVGTSTVKMLIQE